MKNHNTIRKGEENRLNGLLMSIKTICLKRYFQNCTWFTEVHRSTCTAKLTREFRIDYISFL